MSLRRISTNVGRRPVSGLPNVFACHGSRTTPENLNRSSRRDALASLVTSLSLMGSTGSSKAANLMFLPREDATRNDRQGEIRHSDEEWREILSSDQYAVLREAATERRFSSPLVDEHRRGIFCCAGCGADLFSSSAKYESGTGWPSFYEALPGSVDEVLDKSIPFMPRQEVRCHRCQSHIGHVFDDGPEPTGLRYCMNGLALNFKPDEA